MCYNFLLILQHVPPPERFLSITSSKGNLFLIKDPCFWNLTMTEIKSFWLNLQMYFQKE